MVQIVSSGAGKRLWRIVRAVFFMLGNNLSIDKLRVDLHLLLQRGKLASRALSNLITFHYHHRHHRGTAAAMYSAFTCRSVDPNRSFHSPMEVQFSCSSTPSHPASYAIKRRSRRHHHLHHRYDYDCQATTVAEAFEIHMNSEIREDEIFVSFPSPVPTRQHRLTDLPFLSKEDEDVAAGRRIDQEAEDFIRRFYEQLRLQQRILLTGEA